MWDVKRYVISEINSKFDIIPLYKLIKERSEKVKLFDYHDKNFGILGVNNKIGLFDAYQEIGKNINQSYKKVYLDDLTYNPYRVNVGSIGWKIQSHKHDFISPAYIVFSCNQNLLSEYLYKLFKTSTFNKIINDNTTGSVRQNLKFETLSAIKIPLPPLKEQNRIVESYNKRIQLAKQYEQEAILLGESFNKTIDNILGIKEIARKIISGGLLRFINYKTLIKWGVDAQSISSIGYFKDYPVFRLSDVSDIGSGGTPSRSRKDYYKGNIPWIKTGEVINEIIFDTEEKITQEAIENSSAKIYKKGSLIIAMYGQGKTRGRTAKLGVDATTNQACAVIYNIDSSKLVTDFLWLFLMNEYDRLRKLASGNNQPNLNAQMIKNYPIVVPPKKIQQEIVDKVFALKQKIKNLQASASRNRKLAIEEFEQKIFQ